MRNNSNAIHKEPLVCTTCGKPFRPLTNEVYCKTKDGHRQFICEPCVDKWKKRWTTANIEIQPMDERTEKKLALVKFADGQTMLLPYGSICGVYDAELDAPNEFFDNLGKLDKAYYAEVNKKVVASCEFTEGYEENICVVTFADGHTLKLHYKYGRGGCLLLDPVEMTAAKVSEVQQREINRIFSEQQ